MILRRSRRGGQVRLARAVRSGRPRRLTMVLPVVAVVAGTIALAPSTLASAAVAPVTASITPATGQADVATDYVLTFVANAALSNGAIHTEIPSGWTLPQTTNAAGAGYVLGAPGSCTSVNATPTVTPLSGGASQVTLTGITCAKGEQVKLKYFNADPLKDGRYAFGPTSVATSSSASFVAVTAPSVSETVGPTSQFAVTSSSLSATAGAKYSFTVTPEDAGGDVSVYAGTISFTSSDAGSSTVLPAPTVTAGTRTFSATLTTAGVQSITATDAKAKKTITGTLGGITVNPAATSQLTWSAVAPIQTNTPGEFPVSSPLSFTLTAMDKYRNVTPAYAGKVAFTSSTDHTAVLPAAYTFVPGTDHGSHSFLLTPKTAGSETYTATDSHTTTITGKTVVPVSLAVVPEATADLSGTVSVPFSQTFTATGATGSVTWTSTNLPSWLSLGRTSGVATGTPMAGGTYGPFTITATDAGTPAHSGSWSYSIAVGLDSQTVAFTSMAPSNAMYGDPTYVPTGTSSSGLPVTFTADAATSAVCTGSDGVITLVGVGTCTVDANQAGNANYSAAPQVQQSFTVSGASQTISFTSAAPTSAVVDGAIYTPTATATSGLGVTLGVDDTTASVCSMSGGVVSFTAIGTCTIDATQGGNADWLAAPEVQQSFAVSGAPQTIDFTSSAPSSAVVGGATYAPTATASPSGLPVTLTVDGLAASVCSIDANGNVSFSGVGVCIIDANQAGDDTTWAAAPQVQQSFSVGQGSQTISFTATAPSNVEVNGPTYAPAATTTAPGLTVALSIDPSSGAVCSMDGSGIVSFNAAGTCTIDANQGGDADWMAAPQVQQSIVVGDTPYLPSGSAVTLTRSPGSTVDLAPSEAFTLTSASTAFTFDASAFVDPAGGSVADGNLSFHWVIIYSNNPSTPYTDAGITGYDSPVLQISREALENTGTGTAFIRLTVQSGINPVGTTTESFQVQVSNGALTLNVFNTCQDPATESQCTIPVALPIQQTQSLSFTTAAPSDAVVNGSPYTPEATSNAANVTSAQPVVLTIDPSSGAVCTMAADGSVSFGAIGTCTVDANEASSPAFLTATQVQQSFTVSGEPQTIGFTTTAPSEAVVGGPTYAPTAAATSGEAVGLTVDGLAASVCSIDGNGNVSFTGVGVCIIDANQAGDDTTWAAAPQVQQSFSVGQGSQTISFTTTAPSNVEVNGPTYAPAASTTAPGLTVALSVDPSSSGVCSMDDNGTVSFTAAGTCTIDANQGGDADWTAAPQVQQSIVVADTPYLPPDTSITLTRSPGSTVDVAPSQSLVLNSAVTAFTFDASAFTDPAGGSVADGTLSFHWVIIYSNNPSTPYTDAGITGYDSPVLQISKEALENTGTGTAVIRLTVQSGINPAGTTTVTFPITVTNGALSLSVYLECQNPETESQCTIPVALPEPEPQSLSFTSAAPSDAVVNGPSYTPAASSNSAGDPTAAPVVLSVDSSSSAICTMADDGSVTFDAIGTCTIDADEAASTNWFAAPQVQQSFTVSGEPQTIGFTTTAPSDAVVGGPTYAPAAAATSGEAVGLTVDDLAASVCSIDGNGNVSFTGVGVCIIDANQAGDDTTWAAAPEVQQMFDVAANEGITFTTPPPSGADVGGLPYTPAATSNSTSTQPVVLTVDGSSSAVCTMAADGSVTFTAPGTCTIDANQAGDTDTPASPQVQQSFTVVATQAATAQVDVDGPEGDPQTAVLPPDPATAQCPAENTIGGGCAINELDGTVDNEFDASVATDPNPDPAGDSVSYDWTIYYPPAFGLNTQYTAAGISGYHSSQLYIVAGSLPQLAGNSLAGQDIFWRVQLTVTVNGVASTTDYFRFAYNSDFSLQVSTDCQLTGEFEGVPCSEIAPQLLPVSQTVSFTSTAPSDAVVGGPTYTPTATSTSGLPVALTIDASSSSVCSMAADGSVSFAGVGTCTIDANQGGAGPYPAAPQVQQSFAVGAPYPQVTADTIEDSNPADDEIQSVVVPPNPGINDCPAQQFPDGGCTIADLDGTVDNTFSASLPTAPGTNVTYKWQIYYPPIFGPSVTFQDAGITGSNSPVLHIDAGSMPELASDSRTSGDPYWRAELTTTVNGTTSTSAYFRFIYDSSFSLDFSTDCLLSSVFDGFDCAVVAPQLLPTLAFTTTAPTDAVVGGPTYTPAATINGLATGLTLTIDPASASVCTMSAGDAVSFTGAGTCTVDLNQTNRPTNLPAEAQQSFQVGSG